MSLPRPPDRFETALGAATRAVAGTADLELEFTTGPVGLQGRRACLPQPSQRLEPREVTRMRGIGDAAALELRHHRDAVHLRYRPPGPSAARIFDALEQARVESIGAREMPGVARNLAVVLAEELHDMHPDRTGPAAATALAARLSLRDTAAELPGEMVRGVLEACPDVSAADFGRLAEVLDSQEEFARRARTAIAELGYAAELGNDPDHTSEPNPPPEDGDTEGDAESGEAEETAEFTPDAEVGEQTAVELRQTLHDDLAAEVESGEREEREAPESPSGPPGTPAETSDYTVYCHEFDEVVNAAELCDAAELDRHRISLDRQVEPLRPAIGRLANRLQRRLQAQQARSWMFDLEDGLLDTGRLVRVVTSPLAPLSFKREQESLFRDTVVTLLLDNSGSMRGRPIATAAVCAEILGRTLERCGVQVEILGFTTRAWKGGESRERWLAEKRSPPKPGRLNDLRHIIYKAADAPWGRARRNLALMLREGLLKENIDGEALEWAHARLALRPERRKILLVISDGAPIDDATLAANGAGYLERHLRRTVAAIEKAGWVELVAIGIGHDVTRYYRRAITINTVEQLAGTIADQLAELFEQEPLRPADLSRGGRKRKLSGTDAPAGRAGGQEASGRRRAPPKRPPAAARVR